jgi:hypothetical protein
MMEALPLLVFGPPHVSNLGMVFWAHGWCVHFSSLRVGIFGRTTKSLVSIVTLCFHNMTWPITISIVRFFKLYILITSFSQPSNPFSPHCSLGSYFGKLDLLSAFHFGFFLPQLYVFILFILHEEVHVTFRLPLDWFIWNSFDAVV